MIKKITWSKIVDMLQTAREEVILIMPAIHEEWVNALELNSNLKDLKIFACIDNSEVVIRNGYGSIEGLENIAATRAEITECDGLRITFISADDEAYFLFLESRILSGNPEGVNGIEVPPQMAEDFVGKFFEQKGKTEVQVSQPFGVDKFFDVRVAIEKNPPEAPDLKRRINTYTTLFQYMEVHFEGANLQSATISIPPKALPFKDEELKKRMKTKFNLFTKDQTDRWDALLDIKQKVETLRKNYLTPCKLKKNRSILKKEERDDFLNEFEDLQKEAEAIMENIINNVQSAILDSKLVLKKEITIFFENNPPDDIQATTNEALKKRMIEDHVYNTLSKVKMPSAHELISKMKLEKQDAEFTTEDLDNEEFLNWLKEKELISEADDNAIANYSKAFQIRR